MEPHACDANVLVAARETVGLLFADPLREAIRLLCITRMLLVERKIVEARREASEPAA
jgi:hypothetical protein